MKAVVVLFAFALFIAIYGVGVHMVTGSDGSSSPPVTSAVTAASAPFDPEPGIDEFNALTTKTLGGNLFVGFSTRGDIIVLKLSPRLWNRLRSGEQRQLCDLVAKARFLQDGRYTLARLQVAETVLGRVDVRIQKFRPELNSLK